MTYLDRLADDHRQYQQEQRRELRDRVAHEQERDVDVEGKMIPVPEDDVLVTVRAGDVRALAVGYRTPKTSCENCPARSDDPSSGTCSQPDYLLCSNSILTAMGVPFKREVE